MIQRVLSALHESRVQQRQLVMDASHELRTPLTSLRTNIDVLARADDLPESDRQLVRAAHDRVAGDRPRTGGVLARHTPGHTGLRDRPHRRDAAGTLTYLLADHLGSTVGAIAPDGTVSTQTYWPFGATRTAGALGTDKQYTGQQQEATGALQDATNALGLYFYHARFYATVTGRFVSADPITKDGLNRYTYVRDNPLRLVDPSGLDAGILCGTGDSCESGGIGDFKAWVIGYWQNHEHIFGGQEDYAFAMLEIVLGQGWDALRTLSAFHVGFIDTIPSQGRFENLAVKDNATHFGHHYDALEHWENVFWKMREDAPREIDTLIGYSAGGAVVARILEHAPSKGYSPEAAILLQPAFHVKGMLGFGTTLRATDLPRTTIVTVNDSDPWVHGTVPGAVNLTTSGDCGGSWSHCTDQQIAPFVTWLTSAWHGHFAP